MKILNLYSGLGGNRKLWGSKHRITSVEINEDIASIYSAFYPEDELIIGDAHKYLIENFDRYDFIWASPPCPSHSRINTDGNHKPQYPDLKLYEEIIFLSNNWYKGKYVVENVIPYYEPLVMPSIQLGRHFFWCNFYVSNFGAKKEKPIEFQGVDERYGVNLKGIKTKVDKRKILRNLVDPEIGKHFLDCADRKTQTIQQRNLFI